MDHPGELSRAPGPWAWATGLDLEDYAGPLDGVAPSAFSPGGTPTRGLSCSPKPHLTASLQPPSQALDLKRWLRDVSLWGEAP